VELLEYVTPETGRRLPADAQMNDLWAWQTTLLTLDAKAAADEALADGSWISPGVCDLSASPLGLDGAAMIRDPDGHAILLGQP